MPAKALMKGAAPFPAGISKQKRRTVVADKVHGQSGSTPPTIWVIDAKDARTSVTRAIWEPNARASNTVRSNRIDTDGKVVEVTPRVDKPNGIALSPTQRRCTWPITTTAPNRIVEGENPHPAP